MTDIIGVRFRGRGKTYYFKPGDQHVRIGDKVIVETSHGLECADVTIPNRAMEDESLTKPLKTVVRKVSEDDKKRLENNREKERQAFRICQEKIAAHKLEMKLVTVEYAFDGSKIVFYFTADGRVDFRSLVKDLAGLFHTRIELRQIGVRDEAKMLGGLGSCGQPLCCARFLSDFQPVSIKMAKEQGLSLNPTKISGTCGRLMCCLKYEQEAYSHLLKLTPKTGALVSTAEGKGMVTEVSLLTGQLKVQLEKSPDSPPITVHRDDIKVIRDGNGRGKPKGGMPPKENEPAEKAPEKEKTPAQTDK